MTAPKIQNKKIRFRVLPNDQLTVIHFWYKNQFPLHTHSYYEILILTKGTALHYLNGHPKVLKQRSLVLLRPNDHHELTFYKDCVSEHVNIAINSELFHELCNSVNSKLLNYFKLPAINPYINLKNEDFEYLLHLANSVNLLQFQDIHKRTLLAKQIVFNILTLFDNFSERIKKEYPSWFHDFLEKLNFPTFFLKPANKLYQYTPYSQSKFSIYFKRYTGVTLIEYLTNKKINYACNLLENTNFSILEISNILNYDSLAHFHRIFKKRIGVTPREYRLSNGSTQLLL